MIRTLLLLACTGIVVPLDLHLLLLIGYAATDIIQTLFRVTRTMDMPEPLKLEFIREIGFTHMRISEGLNTQLQLMGCVARLCAIQHRQQPRTATTSSSSAGIVAGGGGR